MGLLKQQHLMFMAAACAVVLSFDTSQASWDPNGTVVCAALNWQGGPAVASDGDGGVIVVWQDGRPDSTSDIYAQRLSESGVPLWTSDGVPVCTAPFYQTEPMIVSDGNGGAVIVWTDGRTDIDLDVYAQRLNADGTLQWAASGVPVAIGSARQWFPAITADGAGGVMVTWTDNRNSGDNDIYAQWLDGSGVAQWTANGIALCANTAHQSLSTIASDGVGGAIVTWPDRRNGQPDIYVQRVSVSGVVQWTADGVSLCAAVSDQSGAQIVADGVGGAIVTWTDRRSGTSDMYAQRVSALGVPQWATNGINFCNAASNQSQAWTISDGAGGAIVTWVDPRDYSLNTQDIYTQRIDPSGNPMWTPNGVPVCTAVRPQLELQAAGDGSGGVVVAWQDARSGPTDYVYDIYAQRVSAAGAAMWTVNGVAVCTAMDDQSQPALANDGSGVVIAWGDSRSEDINLYAHRLTLNGQIPSAVNPGATPSALALGLNIPNPFSNTTRFDVFVSEPSDGALEVYDVAGRRVANRSLGGLQAGWQQAGFDGRDNRGLALPSGVYFLRVKAGGVSSTRKIVIQR